MSSDTFGPAASAGACQAPQTTTTRSRPSRSAARMARRMWASRSSSRGGSSGHAARSSPIASWIAANAERGAVAQLDDVLPPPLGVGVAGGGGEGGERVAARPAVLRRVGVARARSAAAGRSIMRTSTSCASAQRSAIHSGEKAAKG